MYTRSWEQFPGWGTTLYCMGPLAMPLLLELEAKKSVLQPAIRERCILLELSTRGQAMEKSILFWSLERDLPRNQEENSFLPKSPSSTLYRQALMSCWVAKEKYLQGPILLSQSMQKG